MVNVRAVHAPYAILGITLSGLRGERREPSAGERDTVGRRMVLRHVGRALASRGEEPNVELKTADSVAAFEIATP